MNMQEKDLKYIWHPCSQMKDYEELPPIVVDHAQGLWLFDINGKRYADVIGSWWCNLLGHTHPRINRAVKEQIDHLEHVIFANFSHTPAICFCEKLAEKVPKGLSKFYFTDNGSSAIEVSLKMSFQYHYQTGNRQKQRFMALSDAYHGETLGALSVGGVDLYSQIYQPLLLDVIRVDGPDCFRCPYGKTRECCQSECFENAEKALKQYGEETSAFIVEPLMQGAAGMKFYPPSYLKKLRKCCDQYHVHLIADEIATGFGRTGTMFACEQADISPDFLCLSKGMTGGYLPMAVVATKQIIYDAFYADYQEGKAFVHSHTYAGNPLACSAALEILRIFEEENILESVQKNAVVFRQMVQEKIGQHKNIGEIRQLSLINAFELVERQADKKPFEASRRTGYQVYKQALKKGLLLRPIGDVLYFNPPLTITPDEMDWITDVCQNVLEETLGK